MKIDKTAIRPYGDTMDDGRVQLSFTIPMEASPEAQEAAKMLAAKMGLIEIIPVYMEDMTEGFSFHILYGTCTEAIDATKIVLAKVTTESLNFYEVNDFIKEKIGRPLTVVGACTGTDAHTVGLDAIMNMKGFSGEYGLERYPQFTTYNLGSQVPNEELIRKAVEVKADALLVSQVVTQKEVHVKNLTNLVELLEAEDLRDRFLLVVGGPRITHELALELGFDAGFGTGTRPPEVASYICQTIAGKGKTE